jgi:hypothetical protein
MSGGTGTTFGTLTAGSFTVSSGNLTFASGNMHLDQNISVNSGSGTVTNDGVLQLANTHTITGRFLEGTGAELDIQAGGTSSGLYGDLISTSSVTFAGELALDLVNGFTLAAGDTFDVSTFQHATGNFTSFGFDGVACTSDGTDEWGCGIWNIDEVFASTSLDLTVTRDSTPAPEPASATLFGSAIAALGWLRRRRHIWRNAQGRRSGAGSGLGSGQLTRHVTRRPDARR